MRRLALAAALAVAPLSAAVTLAPRAAAAQDVGLPVGTRAPNATVETLDGKPVDLSRWIGRGPTLLQFWATWCSTCKALEPQLVAVRRKYGSRVALVAVAVSVNQSPARVRAFAQRHPLPVELVYDRQGQATERYDVPATSHIVVLDRTGKVVYTGQGADQNLDAAVQRALR
jgi:peroxiredoxin